MSSAPATPIESVLADALARRIVPVASLAAPDLAVRVADALGRGGLPVIEITFRSATADRALAAVAAETDVLVGAGTITTPEFVDRAAAAGARFIVTPGFSGRVVERCAALGLPVIPGVGGATDVMAALDHGLTTLKLFPAETLGGTATVRALAAPFPQVRFVPTGGITSGNASGYLALPCVAAVGGSWLTPADAIADGRFDEITRLAAEAVEMAKEER